MKIKTKKLGIKRGLKKGAKGVDSMAAARAARGKKGAKGAKGTKKAARDEGMPDPKKLRDRQTKYKEETGVKLLTASKLVGYFKALGLRAPKEDLMAASSSELYDILFRAALRTIRNNRKTVRGFDIR